MSNKVIGDYTAAISVDGSTNYLLIQPGNSSTAYNKINRNVLLGVTGQPADVSTAQSITNKTLDNSNILTVRDDRFTLQDNGDTSKQVQFQLSGLTTATTRTLTVPDRSSTIATLGGAQTFTGVLTMTAPVISGGSIDNSTITVDSIAGHTSPTNGTVYGMSISAGKVGTNGVVTASITDAAVTPAKLFAGTGSSWVWQSWATTWTGTGGNPTIGNGTLTSVYTQIGKTVHFRIFIVMGSTTTFGSGTWRFTPPVTPNSNYNDNSGSDVVGGWGASISSTYAGFTIIRNPGAGMVIGLLYGVAPVSAEIGATSPANFANGSVLKVTGTYEAA